MSLELALTIGGIVLTVVTFLFGYRRTIGALNERTKIANDALIVSLEKHLSLSNVIVSDRHIESLRSGQAYISGVDVERMIPRALIRDVVATRIFQNEYLSFDEKDRSLKALSRIFEYNDEHSRHNVRNPKDERPLRFFSGIYEGLSSPIAMLGFASALISSLAATIIAGISPDGTSLEEFRSMALPLGAAIIGTATALVFLTELKRRSSRRTTETPEPLSDQQKMFSEVYDVISEIHEVQIPIEEVDFYFVDKSNRNIGVEIRGYPVHRRKDFLERLESGKNKFNLDEIVVISSDEAKNKLEDGDLPHWISVLNIEDAKKYIKEISPGIGAD